MRFNWRRGRSNLPAVGHYNSAQKLILGRYGTGMTWREIGAEIGISGGMTYQVAVHDYHPKHKRIRKAIQTWVSKYEIPKRRMVWQRFGKWSAGMIVFLLGATSAEKPPSS